MINAEDKSLKINVRLIRRIQRAILKWPENYDQSDFGDGEWGDGFKFNAAKMQAPTCGSAACIAGWAVALSGQAPTKLTAEGVWIKARRLLGLTKEQAGEPFAGRSATPKRAVKALDRLIATRGEKSW